MMVPLSLILCFSITTLNSVDGQLWNPSFGRTVSSTSVGVGGSTKSPRDTDRWINNFQLNHDLYSLVTYSLFILAFPPKRGTWWLRKNIKLKTWSEGDWVRCQPAAPASSPPAFCCSSVLTHKCSRMCRRYCGAELSHWPRPCIVHCPLAAGAISLVRRLHSCVQCSSPTLLAVHKVRR